MSLGEQVGECLRSKFVRILLLILLLVLIGVGVFLLLRSSPENNDDKDSLDFGPKVDGQSFIRYDVQDQKSVIKVKKALEDYLNPYNSSKPNSVICSTEPAPAGKTCDVNLADFNPCVNTQSFGLFRTSPCVFLKLTKNNNWTPKLYNETQLPESMPAELKNVIKDYVKRDRRLANFVWVSCDGKSEEDKKNVGSVQYYPRQGFPGFYYPCTSQEGCNQPLVAVQFQRIKQNEKISVQCKVWSENLYDTVDFEIMEENLAPRRA